MPILQFPAEWIIQEGSLMDVKSHRVNRLLGKKLFTQFQTISLQITFNSCQRKNRTFSSEQSGSFQIN